MISKKELIELVESYLVEDTIKRESYLNEILPFIDRKEILVLKGIRRCGKSTIMQQMMQEIGIKKCVYINLDDYKFLEHLSIDLLELILQTFKTDDKLYLFLDEIQNIPKFESWLRTHYDRNTNVKFIISGSNSKLMTKELGTLLTGRSISFEITPLSYKEFKSFSDDSFDNYLEFGGFPEVVLEKNIAKKKRILQTYFDTIVEKDIIQKHDLSLHRQLKEMLKYLILNPGVRISANKLSKQLGVSINTVKSYLSLAEDVYLIFEVPFFSYSAKTKFIEARVSKYYIIDTGFYSVFSSRFEKSKLVENAIAISFFNNRGNLYYWKGKNEVDFVCNDIAYNVVSSTKVPEREFLGLDEIKSEKKHIKETLLLGFSKETFNIERFLLD